MITIIDEVEIYNLKGSIDNLARVFFTSNTLYNYLEDYMENTLAKFKEQPCKHFSIYLDVVTSEDNYIDFKIVDIEPFCGLNIHKIYIFKDNLPYDINRYNKWKLPIYGIDKHDNIIRVYTKSVISQIREDEDMPYTKDGRRVDLLPNLSSTVNRTTAMDLKSIKNNSTEIPIENTCRVNGPINLDDVFNFKNIVNYDIINGVINDLANISSKYNLPIITASQKKSRTVSLDAFKIKDIKFSNEATIVFWEDGTKTVVKKHKHDRKNDIEKAIAVCYMKKVLSFGKSSKERSFDKIINWATTKYMEESKKSTKKKVIK